MNELTASLIQDISTLGHTTLAWYENILPTLGIISFLISALLIYGIIYAIFKSGYHDWHADRLRDKWGKKDLPERRARRSWRHAVHIIQHRTDKTQWIEALKEADAIMQEGLKMKGYQAINDKERSRQAGEEIATLHQWYTNAAHTPEMPLTHEEAINALRKYKKIIKELGFFL